MNSSERYAIVAPWDAVMNEGEGSNNVHSALKRLAMAICRLLGVRHVFPVTSSEHSYVSVCVVFFQLNIGHCSKSSI